MTDPIQLRSGMPQREAELVKSLPPLSSALKEEYVTIPGPKQLKITRPVQISSDSTTAPPLILLFHGGGFITGSPEQVTRPAREFAEEFGAVVVGASYKFIPEHIFPGSIEDAYDTLVWLSKNAPTQLGVNLQNGFVVGGVSAGGNIAAVLPTLAIERGDFPKEVKITGSYVMILSLLVKEIVPKEYLADWRSREENKNGGGVLSSEAVDAIIAILKPDIHSPLFSPFNSSDEVLKQLPRTYIQVGGKDCLRDDGIVYQKFLKSKGVDVKIDSYPDFGHLSYTIFTQKGDEEEENLRVNTMQAMKWLLRL
ncbi:alpha/beta hydrolase fold-domain-containing protein [Gymnopilus junonius]|uniref:Alpha/beta hydrolase fold-domain-containing protein n=1 Tax=Gymnopilus junonius TaxID=109634 RepID=A0A9P5TL38_GYMJU|nr:alpha/beta hydrolase fold-domain-containing protein [Gymnopilus junonius]